jgi:hypothetical protein
MEIQASIVIDAPAFSVWNLLADFANYPKWNPFITWIKGELEQGGRLDMKLKFNGDSVIMHPTVANVERERQITWAGRMGSSLFASEHRIAIEPLTHDRVNFLQSARFTGPLVSLVANKLESALRRGFEEMNGALKNAAEQSWKSNSAQYSGAASPV